MRVAVVVFPGSNCERDVADVLHDLGAETHLVWHRETDLTGFDGVVLPGGFAHGDALRTGAIARFSPVMAEVARLAAVGAPVLGICNGFQILCEAGLLPGAFIANRDLAFICRFVEVEVADTGTFLTAGTRLGSVLRIPLNSYEGNWVDPTGQGRIVLRYVDDPNGSQAGAAAVASAEGNVVGVMPHPERASDPLLGSDDGLVLLSGFLGAPVPV
ncbi:MAG: phosphoribosylformylglycinamidine synthase subunit PurQ [Actinobacteria bacterium]|nr:phosphoribosylformylglycinamidine synthase subunit PurQ [Actinomycetota bacterium]MCI0544004.1 phosphoribosylformylglycinamidine synthase subunit PurQ [Actinomycetota bacterium]